ncbi:thaumatin-like protein [Fomitiporia mediterranea MF3/22]|uniref:thaumatin-like protein n=1 Tax=Fomitiporia mediterranea (strain MF3/22) TaxID=694068 RepID=UPI0004408673|nr:thaumatin-like protein [Fomitiporia mediterranea MF3/22]EJC99749.1 thaumatin-like protein [Fomitiporia mediterranea MF3/22]
MAPVNSAILYLTALAVAASTQARTFTVKNKCSYTVWPAIYTDKSSPVKPDHPTGWEAKAGSEVSFNVPDGWKSGRIWGRKDCDFSKNPGPNSCPAGGCNGGLECDASTGTGVPPASLAEWTLNGDGLDWYDVSLVDGFNLPISITNNKGCPLSDCPKDLAPDCPSQLKKNGGCLSACAANLDGHPQDSANCCSGSHNTAATCPSKGVQFYSYFKQGCPNSYVYAYDEGSGTALRNCSSSLSADYTLTFCP